VKRALPRPDKSGTVAEVLDLLEHRRTSFPSRSTNLRLEKETLSYEVNFTFVDCSPKAERRIGLFGLNNPLSYIDPEGLIPILPIITGVSAAITVVEMINSYCNQEWQDLAINVVLSAGGPIKIITKLPGGGGIIKIIKDGAKKINPPKFPKKAPPKLNPPKPEPKPPELPKNNGETPHTKRGKEEHNKLPERLGPDKQYDLILDNGLKPDAVDWKNKKIYELKPNNKRKEREGKKQLNEYVEQMKKETGDDSWTREVIYYDK
jgi:Restriction endonuclease fold toxin 9